MGFGKRLHGVKVLHHKNTALLSTEICPIPKQVKIPMAQNMGAPCEPCVAVGDEVKVGQKIGDCEAFFSVPIHSGVSGKVLSIEDFRNTNGSSCKAVVIECDGEQTVSEELSIPQYSDFSGFIKAVRASGVVGLGGAAFPTFIKLNPKNLSDVETLIINAAECEPYITADMRAIIEDTDALIAGITRIMKELGLKKAIIGIEDNKPEAIEILSPLCRGDIKLSVLPSKYPKGGEKVLIYETTGKIVPEGGLPADVGVIVMNVSSVIALETYFKTGMPLVTKRLTVDGGAINNPKNVKVIIGTPYSDVIDFCGGYKEEPGKVMMGGPMMGITVYDDSFPVLKNNNAILAFTKEECVIKKESPCIRCGKCVSVCPFGLMPAAIDRAVQIGDADRLANLKVNLCMECGCCAYICPAGRPLVQTNRLGKALLRKKGGK